MSRLVAWCGVACVYLTVPAPAEAQDSLRPLPIEALLTAPRLVPVGSPSVSPGGSLIAYTVVVPRRWRTVAHSGVPWYAVGGDIWVSRVEGGLTRRITSGVGSSWGPSWSPDGRRLAFLSTAPDGPEERTIHLWVWEPGGGGLRQVKSVQALDPWARLGRLEWLADSRTVVMKAYPDGAAGGAYEAALSARASHPRNEPDSGATVRLYRYDPAEGDPASSPGANNLDALLGNLVLADVEAGSVRRIAEGVRLCTYALSPDRNKLAWAVAKRFARPESHQILVDLYVHDLTSGKSRRVAADLPLIAAYPTAPVFSWSPTSRAIAYRTNGPGAPNEEVYAVGINGRAAKRLAEGAPREHTFEDQRPLWTSDGASLVFARGGALWRVKADGTEQAVKAVTSRVSLRMIERGTGELWSIGDSSAVLITGDPATKRMGFALANLRSGIITPLLQEARWYDTTLGSPPVVTADGNSVVYVTSAAREPPDLWYARIGHPLRPRRITEIAPELGRFSGGGATAIEWRGLEGDTLHGALIYPAGHRPGTRYPLIVQVYGGSSISDDLNRFGSALDPVENVQVLASRGYAVLLADSKVRVGAPTLELLKTVLPGVDRAVELGVADPRRLGIIGHSFGGYSALALLVQTQRFNGAIMRGGFGDLGGLYGQLSLDGRSHNLPWVEEGQGSMGGSPWEVRERYVENSPLTYLDRVTTPLLIVHGGEDKTVGPFLADEIFVGLRRLDKRVEYARYAGEGHWEAGWSLPNQLDYLNRVIAWFDRHVKHAGSLRRRPPYNNAGK